MASRAAHVEGVENYHGRRSIGGSVTPLNRSVAFHPLDRSTMSLFHTPVTVRAPCGVDIQVEWAGPVSGPAGTRAAKTTLRPPRAEATTAVVQTIVVRKRMRDLPSAMVNGHRRTTLVIAVDGSG
jgi:hypothetical protein